MDNPTLLIYNLSIKHDFQIVGLVRFVVPSPKEKLIVKFYIYIYNTLWNAPILPSFVGAISLWPSHQGQKKCLKKVHETYKRLKATEASSMSLTKGKGRKLSTTKKKKHEQKNFLTCPRNPRNKHTMHHPRQQTVIFEESA